MISLCIQDVIDSLFRSRFLGIQDVESKIECLKLCTVSPNFYHKWVEVSFNTGNKACKHCDVSKSVYDKDLDELETLKKGYGFFD